MGEQNVVVWCLLGRKAGDNTQVCALADELGYGFEQKFILARPWELLTHFGMGPTLAGIDSGASSTLQAPWPDLVISAGRRNEPVARWIKQQSGDRTRLVHIGRPWAALDVWDLVVTTPQYFLPQQDNILHNSLPLHRVSAAELELAGENLRERIATLPRPWIAVLVGGDSGRFVFTAAKGECLGEQADHLARATGGSLLVTDSPRTPQAAGDALVARLTAPSLCYRWGSGDSDNPYRGLLALADIFVVTGESMSMLGEAAATGRPLYIFDVGDGGTPWWRLRHSYRYKPLSHRLAMRFGPSRMRRDIGNIQQALVDGQRAAWLRPDGAGGTAGVLRELAGSPANSEAGLSAADELQRTAAAVRRLVTVR